MASLAYLLPIQTLSVSLTEWRLKNQWDPGKKGESGAKWNFQAGAHTQFPFCCSTSSSPAPHQPKFRTYFSHLPPQSGSEKGSNDHFSSRTWSGRSLASIAWHSSEEPCEFKVQCCISLILELFSIAPLVQLSPQPRRNATSVLSFASCCPLQGRLDGQETLGVVISRVISH